MKKITKVIAVVLLGLAMLPAARNLALSFNPPQHIQAIAAADEQKTPRKEQGLNAFFIKFFEERVAKKPIVTQYGEEQLSQMAKEHNVQVYKLRTLLVVQELYKLKGEEKSLPEVAKMRDGEIRKMIFEAKAKYFDPLSKDEKSQLEREYKEWKAKGRASA